MRADCDGLERSATANKRGKYDGQPFIAMELLEGQTLQRRIGARPIPTEELLDLAIQIADALDAAHSKDIVHRDTARVLRTSSRSRSA